MTARHKCTAQVGSEDMSRGCSGCSMLHPLSTHTQGPALWLIRYLHERARSPEPVAQGWASLSLWSQHCLAHRLTAVPRSVGSSGQQQIRTSWEVTRCGLQVLAHSLTWVCVQEKGHLGRPHCNCTGGSPIWAREQTPPRTLLQTLPFSVLLQTGATASVSLSLWGLGLPVFQVNSQPSVGNNHMTSMAPQLSQP